MLTLFLDSEFNGLQQNTEIISIGIVSSNNDVFYAEFINPGLIPSSKFITDHVLKNLMYKEVLSYYSETQDGLSVIIKDSKENIVKSLEKWIKKILINSNESQVEIWSDCLAYDWVLFCELWGGALNLPKNIRYIPIDICTYFRIRGIDTDINREEFAGIKDDNVEKHNSLYDAKVIKACFYKLLIM